LIASIAAAEPPTEPLPDTLTIDDCFRVARERAPEVVITRLAWRAASADSIAAWRNRHPLLSLFGHVTVAPKGFYDPAITNLGDYELKAGVEWPLLDGGDRARERARAANRSSLAAIDVARARLEAGLRAAALAIDVLRLGDQERAQDEALGWLDRLTSLLKAGARAGSRSVADALRVSLERDTKRIDLETTRNDRSAAERELAQLLGLGAAPAPGIRAPSRGEEAPPATADSVALFAALEAAPEVRSAIANRADQRIALSESQRKNALRVNASADAGLAGTDLTTTVPPDLEAENPGATFADRLRRDLGASGTVDFKKPIADPTVGPTITARRRDLEASDLRVANETETQRRIRRDLLARWQAAARKLAIAEASADQAADHVLKMRSLYNAGTSTLLELLDARRVLDETLDRRAEARAENRAARFELEARK
jgi:outer membrane protein TolC